MMLLLSTFLPQYSFLANQISGTMGIVSEQASPSVMPLVGSILHLWQV